MAVFTAILAAVAIAGVAYSAAQQRKAAKAQARAYRAQQRQADIANARERRMAVRNARVMRASIESQSAVSGLTGSSAASASMSNVQSRLGENLSFLDQNQALSQQASTANIQAAGYMTKAAYGQAVTSIASMGMSTYGGPKPQGTG